ncbi:hypothetical protein HMH01_00075 [Halovulum dunhuangense]|uniref:Uncharacterized protein n=1 Tax=Halovulum dunhuangense TaxID=1505036 RepID=A0A849KPS9_9RHOB|nr:hypothetical protein [Halovulum dunhuangense]NNU78819.1 hypothetical protein [Halovulum dunhuangense]
MRKLIDRLFTEDETLPPRVVVAAGLGAYALLLLRPFMGPVSAAVLGIAMIAALALVCLAVLREFLPMMDPRHPDADRFVVWGGFALALLVGGTAFGLWFLPALVLGLVLLWWRARELFEVFPWFETPGNTGARH